MIGFIRVTGVSSASNEELRLRTCHIAGLAEDTKEESIRRSRHIENARPMIFNDIFLRGGCRDAVCCQG